MTRSLTPYQLRFCPARYIDDAHLPHALLAVCDALPDWRQRSAINAWLLDELALTIDYPLAPSSAGWRCLATLRCNTPCGAWGLAAWACIASCTDGA